MRFDTNRAGALDAKMTNETCRHCNGGGSNRPCPASANSGEVGQ